MCGWACVGRGVTNSRRLVQVFSWNIHQHPSGVTQHPPGQRHLLSFLILVNNIRLRLAWEKIHVPVQGPGSRAHQYHLCGRKAFRTKGSDSLLSLGNGSQSSHPSDSLDHGLPTNPTGEDLTGFIIFLNKQNYHNLKLT